MTRMSTATQVLTQELEQEKESGLLDQVLAASDPDAKLLDAIVTKASKPKRVRKPKPKPATKRVTCCACGLTNGCSASYSAEVPIDFDGTNVNSVGATVTYG